MIEGAQEPVICNCGTELKKVRGFAVCTTCGTVHGLHIVGDRPERKRTRIKGKSERREIAVGQPLYRTIKNKRIHFSNGNITIQFWNDNYKNNTITTIVFTVSRNRQVLEYLVFTQSSLNGLQERLDHWITNSGIIDRPDDKCANLRLSRYYSENGTHPFSTPLRCGEGDYFSPLNTYHTICPQTIPATP